MKKTLPFLALFIALLSGCATRPPRAPLPPAAQIDAQTFLINEGYSKPSLPTGQHLHPVSEGWLLKAGAVKSSPILGLVLADEYHLKPNDTAGDDGEAAQANANSLLTISSAGLASSMDMPGYATGAIALNMIQRLFGTKRNPNAVVAQAFFFKHYSDVDAHLPVSDIAPVLEQQMQILAAMHDGSFYGPTAFNGAFYSLGRTATVRHVDINLGQASARSFVGPGFWQVNWKALSQSAFVGEKSAYGDVSIGLRAVLRNYTVTAGNLPGNKMLTVVAVSDLQSKLPFLKDWYVVFNTPTASGGHEWVIVKDGKVLNVIPIREK